MRDALLRESHDGLVAWDAAGRKTFCQHDADAVLRACLDGPDSEAVSQAVAALSERGEPFALDAHEQAGLKYAMRGRAVGGTAAIWIARESQTATQGKQLAAVLDAIPIPIWLRDRALSLHWANRAFLTAVGADSLDVARAQQALLDRAESDAAAAAQAADACRETGHSMVIDGAVRRFVLTHVPLRDGAVAGAAIDVSRIAEAEAPLERNHQGLAHLLDWLRTAVAVFGPDRRLTAYNAAFAQLWGLELAWLDAGPRHDDVLDRLREARKLPEQRDYQTWKRGRLGLSADADAQAEEIWSLPDGRTLQVSFCVNPFGGTGVLYEDVTEKFGLESSLKTLVAAQAATLDVLSEAVAAFGPDGRLALHNAAFAEIWNIDRTMLAARPHIRVIGEACREKFGDDAMWERLAATVSSSPAQRRNWRKIHRDDGLVLSLSTMPLPDRGTLVTFTDVTGEFRVETALLERNEALQMVDRMRADYIKHLSYELRTPLNTILGFAEHLGSGARGTLQEDLLEPVEAIVAGSYALKAIIDDMLADLLDDDARSGARAPATGTALPDGDGEFARKALPAQRPR